VPDRERDRSEGKSGLRQNISLFEENSWLFIRLIPETHRFAADVKNRSIRFFDENNGRFWSNPAFPQ